MINLILASHGDLANGMKNSLKMLCGDVADSLKTVSLAESDSTEGFRERLLQNIESEVENVIVIDIPGGTPGNQSLLLSNELENVHVVSFLNSPLVLELLFTRDSAGNVEDYINNALNSCKNSLGYLSTQLDPQDDDIDLL